MDFNPENAGFVIRTRHNADFVVFWARSREDAQEIWAQLPQDKTPEFLAELEQADRFEKTMEQLGRRAPVTPVLIGLNAAMFALVLVFGGDILRPQGELLVRLGSNYGPLTWNGEYWRLLSSAFLHGGAIHIALNMFALYQGGNLVERLFGSGRFALVYLLSALAGSVVSGWWDPMRNSVGASGAIFGVYGALLAFFALRRADFPAQLWKGIGTSALIFCGYSLAVGAASPMIDNAAHIGGLLGGIVSGLILVRPFAADARANPQPARLAWAAAAVLLPLLWVAKPLMSAEGAAHRSFAVMARAFTEADAQAHRLQSEIVGSRKDGEDAAPLAQRLRVEVLAPWRTAARPLLDSRDLPNDGSPQAQLQPVMREYIRAKDRALSLTALALQSGDPQAFESARLSWERVGLAVEKLRTLRTTGGR